MNSKIQESIEHWSYVERYARIPANEEEHAELVAYATQLMALLREKKNEHITSLLKLVAQNIQRYESTRYDMLVASPADILQFLMEEHGLGQGDLPEIGSQSLISKILSGERQLTMDHIDAISKRFGVSPAIFFKTNANDHSIMSGNARSC